MLRTNFRPLGQVPMTRLSSALRQSPAAVVPTFRPGKDRTQTTFHVNAIVSGSSDGPRLRGIGRGGEVQVGIPGFKNHLGPNDWYWLAGVLGIPRNALEGVQWRKGTGVAKVALPVDALGARFQDVAAVQAMEHQVFANMSGGEHPLLATLDMFAGILIDHGKFIEMASGKPAIADPTVWVNTGRHQATNYLNHVTFHLGIRPEGGAVYVRACLDHLTREGVFPDAHNYPHHYSAFDFCPEAEYLPGDFTAVQRRIWDGVDVSALAEIVLRRLGKATSEKPKVEFSTQRAEFLIKL